MSQAENRELFKLLATGNGNKKKFKIFFVEKKIFQRRILSCRLIISQLSIFKIVFSSETLAREI